MALVLSVFHDSISKTRGEKSGGKTGKTVGKTVGKTGGLIMTLHKQNGVIRDILGGEIWCRYFTSLTVNVTPVRSSRLTYLIPLILHVVSLL